MDKLQLIIGCVFIIFGIINLILSIVLRSKKLPEYFENRKLFSNRTANMVLGIIMSSIAIILGAIMLYLFLSISI